jgi:hypothetical protein
MAMHLHVPMAERHRQLRERRDGQAERQRLEEVAPVEVDGLRHQLPDGARLRRKRGRERLAPTGGGLRH